MTPLDRRGGHPQSPLDRPTNANDFDHSWGDTPQSPLRGGEAEERTWWNLEGTEHRRP